MISDSELSELLSVPKEWRNGEEKILWPRAHEKYNIEWLEMLWKYLCEYSKDDLTMMENLNIIYATVASTTNSNNLAKSKSGTRRDSLTNSTQPDIKAATAAAASSAASSSNLVLFKLSKNSNLVYTPAYNDYQSETTNNGVFICAKFCAFYCRFWRNKFFLKTQKFNQTTK
jgi:hypothetical protein